MNRMLMLLGLSAAASLYPIEPAAARQVPYGPTQYTYPQSTSGMPGMTTTGTVNGQTFQQWRPMNQPGTFQPTYPQAFQPSFQQPHQQTYPQFNGGMPGMTTTGTINGQTFQQWQPNAMPTGQTYYPPQTFQQPYQYTYPQSTSGMPGMTTTGTVNGQPFQQWRPNMMPTTQPGGFGPAPTTGGYQGGSSTFRNNSQPRR